MAEPRQLRAQWSSEAADDFRVLERFRLPPQDKNGKTAGGLAKSREFARRYQVAMAEPRRSRWTVEEGEPIFIGHGRLDEDSLVAALAREIRDKDGKALRVVGSDEVGVLRAHEES